jgi:PAS domain S-box-containing protein
MSGSTSAPEQLLALVYSNVADVIFSLSVEGERFRFSAVNPAFLKASGLTDEQVIGKYVEEVIPEPSLGRALSNYRRAIAQERTVRWRETTTFPSGRRYGEVAVTPVFEADTGCTQIVGTVHDDTEAHEEAELAGIEQRVLEAVASGVRLGRTLEILTLGIEALIDDAIASVLLLSSDGTKLLDGAGPNLPQAYRQAIDGSTIGPAEGSCGAAASTKEAVITPDIEADPRWTNYRALANRFGLQACWSLPILDTRRRVLGTFAVYYRQVRTASERELGLISRASHVARVAIQRQQLDEQLLALSARIEAVREEERTAVAREIQSPIGEMLATLKMELSRMGRRLAADVDPWPEAFAAKARELLDLTLRVTSHVNRISAELRPSVLDDVGLVSALAWQAEEFEERTRTYCFFRSEVPEQQFNRAVSTEVFRIFQEVLGNVTLFADAHRVDALLKRTDGALVLQVKDDGRGIPPEAIHDPRSVGLMGLRERARRVNGSISFEPVKPHGTVVTLRLPQE